MRYVHSNLTESIDRIFAQNLNRPLLDKRPDAEIVHVGTSRHFSDYRTRELENGHTEGLGTIDKTEARGRISRSGGVAMYRLLVAMAVLLLSGMIGGAQEKGPVVQNVVHATPEKINKAALTMFVSRGYSLDSDTGLQLKVSQPLSSDEIASYNTAHWTNRPVANCRRVLTLISLPGDQATSVTMHWDTVCHSDGLWVTRRNSNEADTQWMQTALTDLKAKIEGADRRH